MAEERIRPLELSDWLISHGRHWVTTGELETILDLDRQSTWNAVSDLKRRGLLFSPVRGAYVPIPSEYRSWGTVPAAHYVDQMMDFLRRPYYVGLLSAAEIHGSAHQRPQVFQVVCDRQLAPKDFGRVRIQFLTTRLVVDRPTITVNTPTGTMRVATTEVVLLDLVMWPRKSGGVSNVATVVRDLIDEAMIDPERLASAARSYPASAAARVGWMIEHVAPSEAPDLASLRRVAGHRKEVVPLVPGRASGGHIDHRWNVLVNAHVEAD